jgi:DNA-binding IclR family transcriptional regulator
MIGLRESDSSEIWASYPEFDGHDGNTVAGLVHGLGIVRLLALNREGLSLSEVAERIKVGKTTAFRLLATLVQVGYVAQDPDTKLYFADYAILEPAGFLLRGIQARGRAGPYLYDLAGRTGLTAVLSVLRGDVVVTVDRVTARSARAHQSEIGFRTLAHASSNGKVILAHLPKARLEAYLARAELRQLTDRTITDPAALREHLEQVRGQGYAYTDGEWIPAVRSVAAPVRNYNGDVIAAVGASSHDLLPDGVSGGIGEILKHVPTVQEAAESVSYSLGYQAAVLV